MKDLKFTLPVDIAFFPYKLKLSTSVAKSLCRICRLPDWSFSTMSFPLRKKMSEEKVLELERVVYDEILKPLEDRLQAEYAKVNLLYEQCGTGSKRKPEEITVYLRHPEGRRFFDLLVGLDIIACKLEDLWIAGKNTESEYKQTVSNCRTILKKTALRIRELVGQAVEKVERKSWGMDLSPRKKSKGKNFERVFNSADNKK